MWVQIPYEYDGAMPSLPKIPPCRLSVKPCGVAFQMKTTLSFETEITILASPDMAAMQTQSMACAVC